MTYKETLEKTAVVRMMTYEEALEKAAIATAELAIVAVKEGIDNKRFNADLQAKSYAALLEMHFGMDEECSNGKLN